MKYWQRLAIWAGYFLGLGLVGFGEKWWLFGLGGVLTWGLMGLDRVIYVWWLYPFEQRSIQVQFWVKQKDYLAAWNLFTKPHPGEFKLVLKKRMLVLIWPLLSVYALTSTGNVLVMGMVMGLGLSLIETAITTWKHTLMLSMVAGVWGVVSMVLLWSN